MIFDIFNPNKQKRLETPTKFNEMKESAMQLFQEI